MDTTPAPTTDRIDSVLVVDDSEVQRRHMSDLCRAAGCTSIYEARDGKEALDILDLLTMPLHLMIVDLEMPGMNGVELMERMRVRHAGVPLIIASGREQILVSSVQAMAQDYGLIILACLRKPVSQRDFQRAISGGHAAPKGPAPTRKARITADILSAAISSGAIKAHYQPKVDIRSGVVRGVEALARWNHPVMGPIPPDQFIPVAESSGLIDTLTSSVMEQAFAQLAQWDALGLNLSMAINLSPNLLEYPAIGSYIAELASRHGVPANRVMLEITESSVLHEIGTALGVLTRLRLKGFGLSIDDYGTGYASMQQLTRIPFTELKVDRSFVHLVHQRKHLEVILRTAFEMARRLGISSVAEGVETLEDWRALQELGCSIGQGWLIAPAMPGDALPAWMKKHELRIPLLTANPNPRATDNPTSTVPA